MNREKAIRLKFYDLMSVANIRYDDGEISIWDEKAEDTSNNIYILLQRQNSQEDDSFCQSFTSTIDVRIVCKQRDTLSKDITDDVGEQVENALSPLYKQQEYEGWNFSNFKMQDASYDPYDLTENDSIVEKVYTYQLTIQKT